MFKRRKREVKNTHTRALAHKLFQKQKKWKTQIEKNTVAYEEEGRYVVK